MYRCPHRPESRSSRDTGKHIVDHRASAGAFNRALLHERVRIVRFDADDSRAESDQFLCAYRQWSQTQRAHLGRDTASRLPSCRLVSDISHSLRSPTRHHDGNSRIHQPNAPEIHKHDTRIADRLTQPRARTGTGRRRLCIR